MNIQQYLNRVRRKLHMPRSLRDRVISDLTTSITAQLEQGLSSEEVLRSMGSPAKTAAELNAQLKEYTYRKSPWRFVFLAAAVLSAIGIGAILCLSVLLDGIFHQSHSIGIIGGADGPTSVFVASPPHSTGEVLLPYILVLIIGIVGYWIFSRLKHKE